MRALTSASRAYFNPPAPCGAGRNTTYNNIPEIVFQSTRPVRGGTIWDDDLAGIRTISIHPPRAGRDDIGLELAAVGRISIHPPRAGRDLTVRF